MFVEFEGVVIMILVGVTGPIASGKTTVCNIFREMGAILIDADKIGHEVLEEPSIKVKMLDYFGEEVLGEDGKVNRSRVADIVFSNDDALLKLNEITHPILVKRLIENIEEMRTSGFPGVAVVDAAMLPFWPEILKKLDYLVMVQSPKWQRANRLIQDRGMPQEHCEHRMEAQEAIFESVTPQIDYIIKNNGDLMEIRGKAVKVWLDIKS